MLTREELLIALRSEYQNRVASTLPTWNELARDNQKMPSGNWNIWLIMAGRGFGKTRAAAEAVLQLVRENRYKRIALIGASQKEAQNVMLEGESGILSSSRAEDNIKYLKAKQQLLWPNGAIANIYSGEHYDQLRGPQFDFAWIDEIAKFSNPKALFDQLNLALRLGENPRIIITTTPRPIKFLKDLAKQQDVFITRGTTLENKNNLSKNFMQQLEYLKGTAIEAQEIFGEIIDDNENGLWTFDDISNSYKTTNFDFEKIIIAVDPSVSSSKAHDETGIIVCATDEMHDAYVIDDLSTHAPPDEWAKTVALAYEKYNAEYVVFENNQGGDVVKSLLQKINSNMKIKSVRATSSKRARAVPIYNLYTKKKIFHIRQFRTLEMQMIAFGKEKKKSPDRVDALVWGLRDLMLDKSKKKSTNVWNIEI